MPFIQDFFAHAFQELEHTNTVHKHNGKSHVHQEIAAAGKKESADKSVPVSKTEKPVHPHLSSKYFYIFSFITVLNKPKSALEITLPSTILLVDYPPPKFIA